MAAFSTESITIRDAGPADAEGIVRIYNHYITDSIITFEEVELEAVEIAERMRAVQAAGLPWVVAESAGEILGYAYAGPFRKRSAYRFTVEATVYLDFGQVGRGLGTQLYAHIIPILREKGFHSVIGGISMPNEASVGLHEKLGFRQAAHFKEVGFKFGRWLDVGYWQLDL